MKLYPLAGLLIFFAGAAYADDPCKAIGVTGRFRTPETGRPVPNQECIEGNPPNGSGRPILELELLARIINNQEKEIIALKTVIDDLTKAVTALDTTSKSLVANDKKWRLDTLDSTIAKIDKLPAAIAGQKALQDILMAALKEKLVKDSAFLDALRRTPSPSGQ